jgi:hypothetical protein
MKYLHDNGVKVITMSDLGYDENSRSLYIKKQYSILKEIVKYIYNSLNESII